MEATRRTALAANLQIMHEVQIPQFTQMATYIRIPTAKPAIPFHKLYKAIQMKALVCTDITIIVSSGTR